MLLTKKIGWMKLIFIGLAFIIFMGLNRDQIEVMRWIAGIFLGLLGVFLMTIILSKVVKRINKLSKEIRSELDKQINKSILKEQNEKRLSKRIKILNEREILYQQASQASSKALYTSLNISFITFITSILISLIPKFNIGTMEDFQLIYFLIILGLYFSIKIIFIFLEILKLDIEPLNED